MIFSFTCVTFPLCKIIILTVPPLLVSTPMAHFFICLTSTLKYLYCMWYQFVAKNLQSGQDSWYKSGVRGGTGVCSHAFNICSTSVPPFCKFIYSFKIQDICNLALWWSYWIVSGKGIMLACASSPSHRNKICREQKVLAEPSYYSLPMADTYTGIMSTERTYGMYLGHVERKKVFLFVFWAL